MRMYTRPKTQTTWGPLVRAHREAKALTRDELADASGISCSMITKVELGVRTPSPKILLKLGSVLGDAFRDTAVRMIVMQRLAEEGA